MSELSRACYEIVVYLLAQQENQIASGIANRIGHSLVKYIVESHLSTSTHVPVFRIRDP